MTLLEVQSIEDKRAVIKVAKEFFGYGGGTVIWIDGKWDFELEEWRRFETNASFSLSKIVETPLKKFVGKDDYCMSVQSYYMAQYELAGIRCYNECYFFCEH